MNHNDQARPLLNEPSDTVDDKQATERGDDQSDKVMRDRIAAIMRAIKPSIV